MTMVKDSVRGVPTERRAEEIQWLEDLWDSSPDGAKPRPQQSLESSRFRHWPLPVLLVGWPVFLMALYSIAPAPSEAAATPAWAQALGAGMVIALFFTLAGFLRTPLGYGASAVAAGFGMALGLGCFADGHTGLVTTFQLAGFTALAGFSLFACMRSRRT